MRAMVLTAVVSVAALGTALPAAAQFAKPEDAIKCRQSGMSLMATHFGRLGAMASGKAPFDAKVVADNAEAVAFISKLPFAAAKGGNLDQIKAAFGEAAKTCKGCHDTYRAQ